MGVKEGSRDVSWEPREWQILKKLETSDLQIYINVATNKVSKGSFDDIKELICLRCSLCCKISKTYVLISTCSY